MAAQPRDLPDVGGDLKDSNRRLPTYPYNTKLKSG